MNADRPRTPAEVDTDNEGDAELADVLDAYLADVEAGRATDCDRILAEHPSIASRLRVCLAGLGLVEQEGRALRGAPEKPEPAFRTLGDYHLVREIGRGGMGVVYEAEQLSLNRRVALKVLPSASMLDLRQLQRFQAEARAAASLQHPHIVPVHTVGCDKGVYFYAMHLIEGRSLAVVLDELRRTESATAEREASTQRLQRSTPRPRSGSPTPVAANYLRKVVELGSQAAEALDYAHQMGVIHRDVKPGNLLLDGAGRLWVTDFGLAMFGADHCLTKTGEVVGTLRYMSPEQARAKRGLVDHRTDVYGLGATLYELLTLRPLFDGSDAPTLLTQIAFQEPTPPRLFNRGITPELEVVLLKAVARNVEERYATAQDFADDLCAVLEDRPIKARPPTFSQRLGRWARGHRQLVRTGLVLLVLAVLGLGAAAGLIWHEKEQTVQARNRAENLLTIQTQTAEREQRNASRYCLAAAQLAWETNRMGRVAGLLGECAPETRRWEWHYLERQCRQDLLTLRGHQGTVFGLSVRPDGKLLATGGHDKNVILWDATDGREVRRLPGAAHGVGAVAFSPDGATLATLETTGRLRLLRAADGVQLAEMWTLAGAIPSLAWHPDSDKLVTASGAAVQVWDIASRTRERELWLSMQDCMAIAFTRAAGRVLLAGLSREGHLKVWDAVTWQTYALRKYPDGRHGLAFSSDGKLLAIPHDTAVDIVDLASGQSPRMFYGSHQAPVSGVAFGREGKLLATGCHDGAVRLWDTATGYCLRRYRGHTGKVYCVAFSPDGRRLYSCGEDGDVKAWDVDREQESQLLPGGGEIVWALAFRPDGARLATAALDGRIHLVSMPEGRLVKSLPKGASGTRGVAFLPGDRLAVAGTDGAASLWDLQKGQPGNRLALDGEVIHLTADAAGQLVVAVTLRVSKQSTAGSDVRVWDVARSAVVASHAGPELPATPNRGGFKVAVRPDGALLAWAERGGVTLREAFTGREVLFCRGAGQYAHVAFSADGRRLAARGSVPNEACVWDAVPGPAPEERGPVWTLRGHTSGVIDQAFSPDGLRLATSASDRTLRLWDLETGWEVLALPCDGPWMQSVAFSPDGNSLIAGSRLWDGASGK